MDYLFHIINKFGIPMSTSAMASEQGNGVAEDDTSGINPDDMS